MIIFKLLPYGECLELSDSEFNPDVLSQVKTHFRDCIFLDGAIPLVFVPKVEH